MKLILTLTIALLIGGCGESRPEISISRWNPNYACAHHDGVQNVQSPYGVPISAVCKDGEYVVSE